MSATEFFAVRAGIRGPPAAGAPSLERMVGAWHLDVCHEVTNRVKRWDGCYWLSFGLERHTRVRFSIGRAVRVAGLRVEQKALMPVALPLRAGRRTRQTKELRYDRTFRGRAAGSFVMVPEIASRVTDCHKDSLSCPQ